jgi:uncharacterized membrane protein
MLAGDGLSHLQIVLLSKKHLILARQSEIIYSVVYSMLENLFFTVQICALFVWLISHQPPVLFSQNKSAISNQPAVLFSHNKSASAISHQPNEQAVGV